MQRTQQLCLVELALTLLNCRQPRFSLRLGFGPLIVQFDVYPGFPG
jgi:hypothetical protein